MFRVKLDCFYFSGRLEANFQMLVFLFWLNFSVLIKNVIVALSDISYGPWQNLVKQKKRPAEKSNSFPVHFSITLQFFLKKI